MNLYLTKSGRLRRKDNTLIFETVSLPSENSENKTVQDVDFEEIKDIDLEDIPAENKHSLPIESIESIYLFGEISLNCRLMNFLSQKKIPVHFFNYYGNHTGTFLPHAEQLSGELAIRQGAAYMDMQKRMYICRRLLDSVIHNIHSVVNYYARRKNLPELTEISEKIFAYTENLEAAQTPDELMGIEGTVRRLYYRSWHYWLGDAAKQFKRTYHPPETPLNSLISFVNSLLYTACVSELYRTALYPGISYLHAAMTKRFSLALDLTEPFKPIMADRLIFRLWNSRMIQDSDFLPDTNGYILTDFARKKILSEWDLLLRETVFYKSLNRSVSYRQLLRLDCYKLIRHLLEGQEYTPFRMEY